MSTRIEDRWARGMAAMSAMNDKWAQGMARLAEQNAPGAANPLEQIKTGAAGAAKDIDAVARSSVRLSTVMSAMRGNIPAIFQVAGKSAGPVAALLGMAAGGYKLAAANDALKASLQTNELEAWAGQWKRVGTEINHTASIIGGPLNLAFRDATEDLADLIKSWNEWLFPEATAEIAARTKAIAEADEKEKAEADAIRQKAKALAEQAEAAKKA